MMRSVLVDQAADLLGVSRRTVYYRIREGKLETIRTRCGSQRVLMESIVALLVARRSRNRGAAASAIDLAERSRASEEPIQRGAELG
jgi:excisionase family DNA binding protein